ncbi:MAG: serine--tRNA ligase [Candidatus Sungiibacteriota bacterium]|uniref:Serine--tRNA ligase n=1 Tax=Candidatus Sungiibacteriota bacterium TaxID=2750080 RepID=A0A7T5UPR9_9BACT|nr:MAG: serine--tRNA ligase [Candidatus Sungbacteria bacterium]
MLDIKWVRENSKELKKSLKNRGVEFGVEHLLEVDEKHRAKIKEVDDLRAEQNKLSEEIARSKDQAKIESSKELKRRLGDIEFELKSLEKEFTDLMYKIPNIPDPDVPVGKDESDNKVLREVGEKPKFKFKPRDYIELGTKLDLIDTERAAKVSGTRFGYLKHEAPLLEFALIQYVMDFLRQEENIAQVIKEENLNLLLKSFIPVIPPVLIKPEAMRAMGYMERGGDEIYHLEKDNLYLVGTAEQSVGPMHTDEVFGEEKLPHRHIAFSTCFRREAGSYGKDTRGILRVHQFDKTEMFIFATPETSHDEHKLLLALEERFWRALKIPYRVVQISTGDLGDPAAATYDLEAWLPGQNEGRGEYREVTSASNTTDFQARRLNIKVRRKDGSLEFVHMLNGTAFVIGRTLIAILENYQQEDGSVLIPEVLRQYMGGIGVIKR